METEVYRSVYVKCPKCKTDIPKVAGGIVRCPSCNQKLVFRKGIARRI